MNAPNWKNRTLFHGDNLTFLRAMNSESVDLIATDPPFKKGRDFHATPDSLADGAQFQDRWSWERDVHPDWLDQIKDDFPAVWEVIDAANAVHMRQTKRNLKRPRDEVGSDMGAFLCFMAVRLLEMHRLLKPTGSIYLHCDWQAAHYLKGIMDAIFGKANFKNDIIWRYGESGRGAKAIAKHFPRNHDNLLYYAKNRKSHRHDGAWDEVVYPYDALPSHIKKDKRGYFKTAPRGDYTDASVARLRKEGRIYETRTGKIRIRYALEATIAGVVEPTLAGSVWDFPDMMHAPPEERQGYPTQKPLPLYERMILASSDDGDMVLDPFAGCATTCVAAELLGRQWAGIDLWDKAHEIVVRRLRKKTVGVLGKVSLSTKPPKRTDGGGEAAPFLRPKVEVQEPRGPRMSRAQMYEHLLGQHGPKCQGCDRTFDDPRYLELDHNTPRSDGGLNHVSNRILLCGPCNKLKSNTYTLSGLRRQNRKLGYMGG